MTLSRGHLRRAIWQGVELAGLDIEPNVGMQAECTRSPGFAAIHNGFGAPHGEGLLWGS